MLIPEKHTRNSPGAVYKPHYCVYLSGT